MTRGGRLETRGGKAVNCDKRWESRDKRGDRSASGGSEERE